MRKFILIFFTIFSGLCIISQEKETQDPKNMFLEAESYLLYEEYTEALPLYLKLSKLDPANDNMNYKVGLCYLNVPYEKEKSITFLEKAVKNISTEYKINSYKETKAPLDALFYLGNAYRINNQLDKALEIYSDFRKKLDQEIYDVNLVDEQIEAIERAKKYQAKPIYFNYTNLGDLINSRFSETNAVVSGDESTLVYNVKLQFYDALFFSTKVNGKWSGPINIIPDLGVDADVYATGLSYNGKELFIYRSDKYDGNLYVTRFKNGRWTPIVRLNDRINTKFWESHASVSSDGKTLYFTSNRKGGYGGLDIYTATRTDTNTNDWANVTNIGQDINSQYNEETPFISHDGSTLFFSSYGHFNMGGYDIFYSNLLENGKWSAPLNMGYPLNTTDDDLFYAPVGDGNFAYITRYYPDGYGKTDIYRVETFSGQHPRKFILKGIVSFAGELEDGTSGDLSAYIINKANKDTVQQFKLSTLKPTFDTKLSAGKYRLMIQGPGFQKTTEDFNIDSNQKNDEVSVSAQMKALKKLPQEPVKIAPVIGQLVFDKNVYKVITNDPIGIRLNVDPGSTVVVNIFNDTTFVSQETISITKPNQRFFYTPIAGKNILKFKSVSPDNTIKSGEVVIYFNPEVLNDKILAAEMARKMVQLDYTKKMIAYFAADSLKNCLESIDVEKENITTLKELSDFILNQSSCKGLSAQIIDSILQKYQEEQQMAAKLLLVALSDLSTGTLKLKVDSLRNLNQSQDVGQLSESIINTASSDSATSHQLYINAAKLAWEGSAYYYLQNLRKIASGKLKNKLDSVNLVSGNINSPEELLHYLLDNSKKNGYSEEELLKAYFAIPLYTESPALLLTGLAAISKPELKKFFDSIMELGNKVETNKELAEQLFQRAQEQNIKPSEILEALVLANSSNTITQLVNELKYFSHSELKEILNNALADDISIQTFNDLLNRLKSNSNSINKELSRLFLQVSSKNVLKMNNFSPQVEEKQFITASNIAIASIAVIILLASIIAIRRYSKT
jgi:hypothetical protein